MDEIDGVTDIHYASLTFGLRNTAQGNYPDGHPSRYYPRPTGLNFGERARTGIFPLVTALQL